LLFVIGLIALLIGFLLPALSGARTSARKSVCASNLKQLNVASMAYITDFQDRLPGFSWRGSAAEPNTLSKYKDLQGADNDVDAAAAQAVDILRRRSGRGDLVLPKNWLPHLRHSALVLQDYLASRVPEKMLACPDDKHLLSWLLDVERFDTGGFGLLQPKPDDEGKLWPYGSSYMPSISSFDRSPIGSRLSQGERSSQIVIPGGEAAAKMVLTDARMASIVAPANKVKFYDEYGRHEGAQTLHFGLDASRQPLAFFDGSVIERRSEESEPGWQPNRPDEPAASSFLTDAYSWNPPTLASGYTSHDPADRVIGKFRWTRDGLAGEDFKRFVGDPVEPQGLRK